MVKDDDEVSFFLFDVKRKKSTADIFKTRKSEGFFEILINR